MSYNLWVPPLPIAVFLVPFSLSLPVSYPRFIPFFYLFIIKIGHCGPVSGDFWRLAIFRSTPHVLAHSRYCAS